MSTLSKAIIGELIVNISTGNSNYYAFASNPVPTTSTANQSYSDYAINFISDWGMLFGKKIANTDLSSVITNIPWIPNSVYASYDNTVDIINSANPAFYVVTSPLVGGGYNIYKCIDNANNSNSVYMPSLVQQNSFTTQDGYTWKYITTISSESYLKFAAQGFIPIYPNTAISSTAYKNSGIEKVVIVYGGNGYSVSYNTGIIQSVANTTLVQIANNANILDTYSLSSIYISNNVNTSELKNITSYVSNTTGNWVYLDTPLNPSNVTTNSKYIISPRVVLTSDAEGTPYAYSVVNTASGNGSGAISSIVMIDEGYGMTWANVSIVTNQTSITPANVYAIVPPAGGHGADPEIELLVRGFSLSFSFANSQSNTIVTSNANYNVIGILKNPYAINATSFSNSGILYTANTFNQILQANTLTTATFTVGGQVTGTTSNALGTVVFSNSSVVYLTGDKYFANGEYITDGSNTTQINIFNRAAVYTKAIKPIYAQNISNVTRSDTETESFKIIIQT